MLIFILILSILAYLSMVVFEFCNLKSKRYDFASSISSMLFVSFMFTFLRYPLHWSLLYSVLAPLALYGLTLIIIKVITK